MAIHAHALLVLRAEAGGAHTQARHVAPTVCVRAGTVCHCWGGPRVACTRRSAPRGAAVPSRSGPSPRRSRVRRPAPPARRGCRAGRAAPPPPRAAGRVRAKQSVKGAQQAHRQERGALVCLEMNGWIVFTLFIYSQSSVSHASTDNANRGGAQCRAHVAAARVYRDGSINCA